MLYDFARWFFGLVGLVPAAEVAKDLELLTEVHALDPTPDGRQGIIRMGITAAKAGLADDVQVEAAARAYHLGHMNHLHDLWSIREHIQSMINRVDPNPNGHLPNE